MLKISFAVFIDRDAGQVVSASENPFIKILPGKIKNALLKLNSRRKSSTDNAICDGDLSDKYGASGIIEKVLRTRGRPEAFLVDSSVKYIYTDEIPVGFDIYEADGKRNPNHGDVYISVSYNPDFYFPLSELDKQLETVEKGIILDMLKGIGAKNVRVRKCSSSGEDSVEKYAFERPEEFCGSRNPLITEHSELSDFQFKNLNNSAPKPDVLTWREADFGILDDIANELGKKLKKVKSVRYFTGTTAEYHFYVDSFYDKVINETQIRNKSKALVSYCISFVEKSLVTTACFILGTLSLLAYRSGKEVWAYISALLFMGSYIFIAIAAVKAVISFIKSEIRKSKGEKQEPSYRKIKRYAKIVEHICEEHEEDAKSEIVVSCEKLVKETVILAIFLVVIFVLLFMLRSWTANHFHNCTAMEIMVIPFKTVLSHLR